MHKQQNQIFIQVRTFPGEEYVFRGLIFALIACIAGYAYFVSLSIGNVIAHKVASAESDRLQTDVGTLEKEYFELSKAVTPALAADLGLTNVSNTSFVRRPGAVGSAQPARTDL